MKILVIAALVFLSGTAVVFADYDSDLKAGNIPYSRGDFETALKFYEKAYAQKQTRELENYIMETKVKMAEKRAEEKKYPGANASPKNIFSLNVFTLFVTELDLKYVRATGMQWSCALSYRYAWFRGNNGFGLDSGHLSEGLFDIDWFPVGYSPQGPYCGAGLMAGKLWGVYTEEYENPPYAPIITMNDYSTLVFGLDVHGGYRWIINSMLVIDVLIGVAPDPIALSRIEVDLGYAF